MRKLFDMDKKDYADCTHSFVRDSARSIVIRNGKVAMIYSRKYGYYKFPGGGIEKGETAAEAMIRETREETGLTVVPETIKEYGYVHRIQRSDSDPTECFIQDNYYFLCDALDSLSPLELDDYEAEESFQLVFTEPFPAIRKNRDVKESPYNKLMFEREARVLEMLIHDGLVK